MGRLGYNSDHSTGKTLSTFSGLHYPGVAKPPALADLKQWLVNYDDGFEYVDKIDPLQVALPTAAQVNCISFDGAQWIASTAYYTSGNKIIVECWACFDDTTSYCTMISASDDADNQFHLHRHSSNELRFRVGNGSANEAAFSGVATETDRWYLVRGEFDGSTISIYVDGDLKGTQALAGYPTISNSIKVGGYDINTPLKMVGKLSGVSVDGLFNCPLSKGTGTTASDVSGNGNHGTFGDGVTESTFPTWTTGNGPAWNLEHGHTPALVIADESYVRTPARVLGSKFTISVTQKFSTGAGAYSVICGNGLGNAFEGEFNIRKNAQDTERILIDQHPVNGVRAVRILNVGALYDDGMHTLEVSYDAGNWTVFLDGAFISTGTFTSTGDGFTTSMPMIVDAPNPSYARTGPDELYRFSVQDIVGPIDAVPLPNGGGMLDLVSGAVFPNGGGSSFTTSHAPAIPYKTSAVAILDGVGDYLTVNNPPTTSRDEVVVKASLSLPSVTYTTDIVSAAIPQDFYLVTESFAGYPQIKLYHALSSGGSTDLSVLLSAEQADAYFDDGFHEVEVRLDLSQATSTMDVYIDGSLVGSSSSAALSKTVDITYVGGYAAQRMRSVAVYYDGAPKFVYDITKQVGKTNTTVPDDSGNGNDGTWSTGAGGLESIYAMRVRDDVNGIYVDAVNYLDLAMLGSAIYPCVHNAFEGALRESDTYFSDNAPNRWHDGVSFLDVYWSDIIAHSNGTDNSFQKTDEKNGNCRLKELGQYDFDKDWTPTEWIKAGNYWAVCDSFADPLVPYPIDSGDGIGPDGNWYPIDDQYVYLVEDV